MHAQTYELVKSSVRWSPLGNPEVAEACGISFLDSTALSAWITPSPSQTLLAEPSIEGPFDTGLYILTTPKNARASLQKPSRMYREGTSVLTTFLKQAVLLQTSIHTKTSVCRLLHNVYEQCTRMCMTCTCIYACMHI